MSKKKKIILGSGIIIFFIFLIGAGVRYYYFSFIRQTVTAEELQRMPIESRKMILEKTEKVSQIKIREDGFDPELVEVEKGKSLCWINDSATEYSIVWQNFESPAFKAGSWCQVFFQKGKISYSLKNKPQFKGTIIVK